MVRLKFKNIGKKNLAIIITAALLALLITAYVIISAVINSMKPDTDTGGTGGSSGPVFDASIGESSYGENALALPRIVMSTMTDIRVESHNGSYRMSKPDGESYFIFWYDKGGEEIPYVPDITGAEKDFDYTSLYAVDPTDTMKQTKISKLCSAVGNLVFDYFVDVKADDLGTEKNEREGQLKMYGFGEDEVERIKVTYLDSENKKQSYTILIGDKLISGRGYYFMIEGRERIYSSVSSSRLDYALGGFESFVHSRVIATGLTVDKTFEPYLTTDYQQYKNNYVTDTGEVVPGDATVIVYGNIEYPIYTKVQDGDEADPDGYVRGPSEKIEIDLKSLKGKSVYSRVVALLQGKTVDKNAVGLGKATVVNGLNTATLFDADTGKGVYTYEITKIESVLTDTEEIFTENTPVLGYNLLKVTYNYSLDGEKVRDNCHAVIDLSDPIFDEAGLSDGKAQLVASNVGSEFTAPVTLTVKYTDENAASKNLSYVITEISEIYELSGENKDNVVPADKISENSWVYLKYNIIVTDDNGVTQTAESDEGYFDLSAIKEGENLAIKNAIIGRGVGGCNVKVSLGDLHFQAFLDFVCYDLDNVSAYIEKELVVSFRFENQSYRDPFYGESTFVNTIAEYDENNPYAIYGLNADNCIKVVRILGGVSGNTTNAQSEGLVGSETVAVGLTPSVMENFYLYDGASIYFELPRGIEAVSQDSPDYKWASTLGFTLYISPVQKADGEQFVYVGSDMYDIVVKMDASVFAFTNYSFADFWARRNLASVSSASINKMEVSFNMKDMVGSYSFRLDHTPHYIRLDGTHAYVKEENTTEYDWITVNTSIDGFVQGESELEGVYDKTKLSEFLTRYNKSELSLEIVYNLAAGITGGNSLLSGNDSLGTDCFKQTLLTMFNTFYIGSLSDAEQTEAKANGSVMRIAFYVDESSTVNHYVYEFYRLDDRRVMVSFYKEANDGGKSLEANAMYISDFAFKKLVRSFNNMLNGVVVDPDVGYDSE